MRPILLAIAVVLLIVSIARFVQITSIIWTEVLTAQKMFNLTWAPTAGILLGSIIIGYTTVKKK